MLRHRHRLDCGDNAKRFPVFAALEMQVDDEITQAVIVVRKA